MIRLRSGAICFMGDMPAEAESEVAAAMQTVYLDRIRMTAKQRRSVSIADRDLWRRVVASLDPEIVARVAADWGRR